LAPACARRTASPVLAAPKPAKVVPFYFGANTLVISPGKIMKRTSGGSRKTPMRTEPTAARVLRAKVQHCCRAWWFVADAAAG
jgi:hypothetical protein